MVTTNKTFEFDKEVGGEVKKYYIARLDTRNWCTMCDIDVDHHSHKKDSSGANIDTPEGQLGRRILGYHASLSSAKQSMAEYVALNESKDYEELCDWIKKIDSIK